MKLLIIYTAVFLISINCFADSGHEQLRAIQEYYQHTYEGNTIYGVPVNFPFDERAWLSIDQSNFRQGTIADAGIQYPVSFDFEFTYSMGMRFERVNEKAMLIANQNYGFKVVDYSVTPSRVVTCDGEMFNSAFRAKILRRANGKIYIVNSESEASLTVRILNYNDFNCSLTKISTLPHNVGKDYSDYFNAAMNEDTIDVFQSDDDDNFILHTKLDLAGKRINQKRYDGLYFGHHYYAMFNPFSSDQSRGLLIIAWEAGDSNLVPNLYRLKDGHQPVLIRRGVVYASWVENGILISEGSHATSHRLVLALEDQDIILNQPVGDKRKICRYGDTIHFINDRIELKPSSVKLSLSNDEYSYLYVEKPSFDLPKIQQVNFKSSNGTVPALLSTPENGCTACPAVVFLHGGNMNGHGKGHGNMSNLPAFFASLGYAVLISNYWGDRYTDSSITRGIQNYRELDYSNKELHDIEAAGRFMQKVAGVDPKQVYLMGHSNGAMLASNYVTSLEHRSANPYRGVIMGEGFYSKEHYEHWRQEGDHGIRIAVRDTELHKTVIPKYIESNDPKRLVYRPSDPIIGVKNALELLDELGDDYYGVEYHMPEDYYDRVMASRRLESLHDVKLMVTAGKQTKTGYWDLPQPLWQYTQDFVMAAKEMRTQLGQKDIIHQWYAPNSRHGYNEEDEINHILEIKRFIAEM